MKHRYLCTLSSTLVFGVALMMVSSVTWGAPNTGGGPQKTEKQCKDERAKCLNDCNQLIDIDNNIQRCQDRCTDAYIMCTPLRIQPGGKLQGVRPQVIPKQNAPIMRRGVEGGEPSGDAPAAPENTGK